MKIAVVGGGIGGLSAALGLLKAGFDVQVYEQAARFGEIGAGIQISPNASRLLDRLGLRPAMDRYGVRPAAVHQKRWDDGRTLQRAPLGPEVESRFGAPYYHFHRGDLAALLAEAMPPERLHADHRLVGLDEKGERIVARFENGQSTVGDLLIGADGIHSTVRAALYPAEGPPIWSGIMLWRGAIRWPTWRDGRTMAIAGGNFAKFVYYPIAADPRSPEMRLTNWAVMARTGDAGTGPQRREDWSRIGIAEEVLPFVRDRFRLDFVDPAAIIEATGSFYEYPNCDRDPLPRWSFGRVTLLGDAAHPMYPVGSNGASQAILDARCLAACLTSGVGIEAALARYDAERRPATADIVLANRRGGPEGVIDMIEARAPDGFDAIDEVASYEERKAMVRGYASLAGFARPDDKQEGDGRKR